jgi:tripartite ATP-independent transporter DctP family solute receptor
MLTRRAVLGGAAALAAVKALGTTVAGTRTLTCADVHVSNYPTVEAVRYMSGIIERETAGRLAIRVYHSGQLGRENDTVDLARFGAIDITRVNFAPLNNAFPLTRLCSLPYVFDSTEHMRRCVDGAPGQEILRAFERRGLIGLAFYDSGSRCFYNTLRAVHTPEDLHGLKIRVPPSDIFIGMVEALGANPTPLPYGEVFTALQTRLIDGAENNWRSFHSSRQFEVAHHWAQTNHSFSPEALLMSKRIFEQLDPREQEIVLTAASESVPHMRRLWDQSEADSRAVVISAGVGVTEVDRDRFRHAARPFLERYLRDEDLARLYRSMRDLA